MGWSVMGKDDTSIFGEKKKEIGKAIIEEMTPCLIFPARYGRIFKETPENTDINIIFLSDGVEGCLDDFKLFCKRRK